MLGAGVFLIGLSYLDCTHTELAVALLILAVSTSGAVYTGHFVNAMDIAPQYAGTITGISSGTAAISGIISPYLASRVTESVSEFSHSVPTTNKKLSCFRDSAARRGHFAVQGHSRSPIKVTVITTNRNPYSTYCY